MLKTRKTIYDYNLKKYLQEISKIPLLTPEEEKNLFFVYNATNDKKIKEKLIKSNLRLVVSIAKLYISKINDTTFDFFDLIQEGNEGLIYAVEKFDVTRGFKFSTYATICINQKITRAICEKNSTIRLPLYISDDYNRIQSYILKNMNDQDKSLDYSKIAKDLGYKEEYVYKIINTHNMRIVSLDESLGDACDFTLYDIVAYQDSTQDSFLYENIIDIMENNLTDQEYQILSLRYGFVGKYNNCDMPRTLEEIQNILGISKQRISKVEHTALNKIKKSLEDWGATIGREKTKKRKNYVCVNK